MAEPANVYASSRNGLNQVVHGDLRAIARGVSIITHPIIGKPFLKGSIKDPSIDTVVTIDEVKPVSETIAGWKMWGVQGQAIHRVVVNAAQQGGHRGGLMTSIDFLQAGTLFIEQPLDPFEHLLGQPINFSAGFDAGEGSVNIKLQLLDGDSVVAEIEESATQFMRGYQRLGLNAELDNSLGSLSVRILATGKQNTSFRFSDLALTYGTKRAQDTDLAPDLAAAGRPRGTLLMILGDSCPPGYRLNCDAEDHLFLSTHGDILSDQSLKNAGQGGTFSHDHGGFTLFAKRTTKVKNGAGRRRGGHRHGVRLAENKPPVFKVLACEKI